jgi:hypothetical protein
VTGPEWLRVSAAINRIWPHQPLPPPTVDEWYRFVQGADYSEVSRAVDACALDGSAFPPPIGRILQKVVELQDTEQLWGEVKRELRVQISRHGSYQDPDAVAWSSGDVRELVEQVGWLELCTTPDSAVFEAQCREKWLAIRARRREDAVFSRLPHMSARRRQAQPAPAGRLEPLRALLPAPGGPAPLKVVNGDRRRLDSR